MACTCGSGHTPDNNGYKKPYQDYLSSYRTLEPAREAYPGMITERDTEHIAQLADIAIHREELASFTSRFNEILEYFDLLDQVEMTEESGEKAYNIFREDEVVPSLSQEEALSNTTAPEEGFFRAPRVM